MTFLWIFLAVLYVACWVYVGLATFRSGHYWLFWIGFILPDPVNRRGVHSPRPSAPPPAASARDRASNIADGPRRNVDRGALRIVCTYPDGNQVVEHTLLTLRDGKIARWSGVQAWDA